MEFIARVNLYWLLNSKKFNIKYRYERTGVIYLIYSTLSLLFLTSDGVTLALG